MKSERLKLKISQKLNFIVLSVSLNEQCPYLAGTLLK